MFFITLSCAEYFWPDIIDLLKERMKLAGDDHNKCYLNSPHLVQIVNDYSIVVQEYFQNRVVSWLETVGKEIFDIKHYWVRYEFAPGRGQIHAHLLAIPEDMSVFAECYNDFKVDRDQNRRAQTLADWASRQFGLTASVGPHFDQRGEQKEDNPSVSLRFTDICQATSANSNEIYEDGQKLLHFCQFHTCSKFCMKTRQDVKM